LTIFDESMETTAFVGHHLCLDAIATDRTSDCGSRLNIETAPSEKWPEALSTCSNANSTKLNTVAIHRIGNHNVGHVLGDEIWPMFQILDNFNLDANNFQVVASGNNGGPEYLYDYASKYPVLSIEAGRTHCFENLYAGSNGLSYSYGTPNPVAIAKYRDFLLQKLNITPSEFRINDIQVYMYSIIVVLYIILTLLKQNYRVQVLIVAKDIKVALNKNSIPDLHLSLHLC